MLAFDLDRDDINTQRRVDAFNQYAIDNFGRFWEYLEDPERHSPIVDEDELAAVAGYFTWLCQREGKPMEVCATATACFDRDAGRLEVTLDAFLRPVDLLHAETHERPAAARIYLSRASRRTRG